jgi:hypothetical protein
MRRTRYVQQYNRPAQAGYVLMMTALCLIVAGCTTQPKEPARFEQTECRFELPQGEKAECGRFATVFLAALAQRRHHHLKGRQGL